MTVRASRFRWWPLGWQVVVAGGLISLAACGESPDDAPAAPEPVAVTVATTRAISLGPERIVAGVVQPDRRTRVGTRIAGAVQAVRVDAGDRVAAGDALIEIDARDVSAALEAARRRLRAAEIALEQAQRTLERMRRLYDEELIARVRLEEAEVARDAARADLAQAAAEMRAREADMDYAHVRAPYAGVVAEVLVEEGSFVGPGPPLLILEARERLRVEAGIDARAAEALQPGATLRVAFPALGVDGFGRILALLPALSEAGPAPGLRLRVVLDAPPPGLEPGMVGQVYVPEDRQPRRLVTAPADALVEWGQLSGVFVVAAADDGLRARLHWVQLSPGAVVEPDRMAVQHGLEAGERVVVGEARHQLRDDQPVTIQAARAGP